MGLRLLLLLLLLLRARFVDAVGFLWYICFVFHLSTHPFRFQNPRREHRAAHYSAKAYSSSSFWFLKYVYSRFPLLHL